MNGRVIRALGFFLDFWLTVMSDVRVVCVSVFTASAQIPAVKLQRAILLVDCSSPGDPPPLGEVTWPDEDFCEAPWVAVRDFFK